MPAQTRGSLYALKRGQWGIRWPEQGEMHYQSPFPTKTAARGWFDANVTPRLARGGPSPSLTFDAFCQLFLERHNGTARTKASIAERLARPRAKFGTWTLRELEGAAGDIAAWAAALPTPATRYRVMRETRQAFAAAKRWGYIATNPAVDAGPNPEPRADELHPFTRAEVDALAIELGPVYGAMCVFVAETGLRTNEWVALERRDIDRQGPSVLVQRRASDGVLTPYPKTERRRVPLTPRAVAAVEALPARLDTKLLFPAPRGGLVGLDTWRTREWYPALEAAGVDQRGPYALRHSFAAEALAAGVSIFQLARIMGTSVKMIDRTYGHWAHDSEDHIRDLLASRNPASDMEDSGS